jgi:20S proteasome subunit beta 3
LNIVPSHPHDPSRVRGVRLRSLLSALQDDGTPFLSGMDLIGAPVSTPDFVVSGTCTENLNGMCESMWRPDMNPDELFETVSQCLLAAVDRDALSGWGATVHIITPEGITSKSLKSRMD